MSMLLLKKTRETRAIRIRKPDNALVQIGLLKAAQAKKKAPLRGP